MWDWSFDAARWQRARARMLASGALGLFATVSLLAALLGARLWYLLQLHAGAGAVGQACRSLRYSPRSSV